MMCPYLKVGKVQNYCQAYLGRLMVPSQYEEQYFCNALSYRSCVWYEAALQEAMKDNVPVGA
jgi:hypothetical protein